MANTNRKVSNFLFFSRLKLATMTPHTAETVLDNDSEMPAETTTTTAATAGGWPATSQDGKYAFLRLKHDVY